MRVCCSALLVALAACGEGTKIGQPEVIVPKEEPPRSVSKTEASELAIAFDVPKGWESVPPSSDMRLREYRVPDRDGQEAPAELILFHFGEGGGTLEQNLDNWRQQVTPDELGGEPAQESFGAGGFDITVIDLQGTYEDRLQGSRKDSRLLAAYVAAPQGPYFFKLAGPRGTVGDWTADFTAMLKSLRPSGK